MFCFLDCPCFGSRRKRSVNFVPENEAYTMDPVPTSKPNSSDNLLAPNKIKSISTRRFSVFREAAVPKTIHFSLSQIIRATRNFSASTRIGHGASGTVYKAQLEDGQVVAVKRAKKQLFEHLRTEFKSEAGLLSKIEHHNLVKLLGHVEDENEYLIITEFIPNGTLRDHLDGCHGRILDFNERLEISIGIASGLTYLHMYADKPIIHRDVKSSNVLLSDGMRAKVADFGFARLGPVEDEETHVLTKIKGTLGYIDPEYMRTFKLTTKSDVYSFGILLVEILTGRRPVDKNKPLEERITIRWAFENYKNGNIGSLVDPLMDVVVRHEILLKLFGLAIDCAAPKRADRPCMKSVGKQLWAIRKDHLNTTKRVS